MDKVFMHKEHKELWLWLADNPKKHKIDWPGWKLSRKYDEVRSGCYACEYGWEASCGSEECGEEDDCSSCNLNCKGCPLIWPNNDNGKPRCDEMGGLWFKWDIIRNKEERREIALQIANLPVKPEVITND